MHFLIRNLVMLHVAALAVFLVWVHGGTRVEHLHGVPWLCLAMVELLLVFPPIRKGETRADSHQRVRYRLLRDPLLYVGLVLSGLLLLQWANSGYAAALGAAASGRSAGLPVSSWTPWSMDARESRQQVYWFLPVWAALLTVRHGVLRGGQRRLLRFLVWNGALLALFGFVQNLTGTRALCWLTPLDGYFFATFGYPNHAGAFFTLLFAVSVGVWFQAAMDKDERRGSHWLLAPVVLNFAGAMGSLSRAAMLLTLILLAAATCYCLRVAWHQIGLMGRVRVLGFGPMILLVAVGLFFAFPRSHLRMELANIKPSTFYQETIGLRIFQYRSAWDVAKDHPLTGVGGWGYRYLAHRYVTPQEYKVMVAGKGMANVHNDTLQFLAEHGFLGFGLMLAAVGLLLAPIVRGMWQVVHTPVDSTWISLSRTPLLLRIPPVAWCVLAGTAATFVHSLIDLPFRSPAVLIVWALCLACTPAFLPRPPAAAPSDGEMARQVGRGHSTQSE